MKTTEEIIKDMSHKKLRDGSHKKWRWERCFAGKVEGYPAIELVKSHLALGHKVKAGYTCTQIRGYHDRWILIQYNGGGEEPAEGRFASTNLLPGRGAAETP